MFNPDWLVDAISTVVSNITVKEGPKTTQGTCYHGNSNYIGQPRQPQIVCGPDGRVKTTVTCHYSKDKGLVKDNCACLNNKTACDIQILELAMSTKQNKGRSTGPHVPKNRLLRFWTSLEEIRTVVQTKLTEVPIPVLMSYYGHYPPKTSLHKSSMI